MSALVKKPFKAWIYGYGWQKLIGRYATQEEAKQAETRALAEWKAKRGTRP